MLSHFSFFFFASFRRENPPSTFHLKSCTRSWVSGVFSLSLHTFAFLLLCLLAHLREMRVEKIKQNILKLGPSFRHNWRPFPFQRFPLLYGGISEKYKETDFGKNGKSHIEFTAQLVIFVADYRVVVVVCNAGFFFGSSSV